MCINKENISLLGYSVVLNQEMHSRQVKFLDKIINDHHYEEYKAVLYDVLNDKENKIPIKEAMYSFKALNFNFQSELYLLCYQLILLGNDSFDENEINSTEKDFLNVLSNLMGGTIASNVRNIKKIELLDLKKSLFLIKQKDDFRINLTAVNSVATEDFENIRYIINELVSECDILHRRLNNMIEDIHNPQLLKAFEEFKIEYGNNVFDYVRLMKNSIPQKELASKNFSLALMGRTKAGKSTLHSIMCQEGEEFIGQGGQRTTRFNRVFSWNGLKIIDTPGIGAGEEEGKKDTEIAERVIGQADIICFVVVDDTISTEDILCTLDRIAEYHKPMLIVLNHKDDINKKSHLKKFLENPTDWRDTKKEKNLSGWIERLERNAEKKGYKEIMSVIPVFLLAALKGIDEGNSLYYDNSNYPLFINEIQRLIKQNCLIYKSQTMLDEPSVQLHKIIKSFKTEEEKLLNFRKKIYKIKENFLSSFESLQKETKNSILSCIEREFAEFFTVNAAKFTDENYSIKDPSIIQSNYQKMVEDFKTFDRIQVSIDFYLDEYHEKVTSKIKELEEEIRYANLNISNIITSGLDSTHKLKATFPIRGMLKFISMGLDIAAIWFPPLAFVSIPLSFISGLFKTKKEKEQINKNRTRNAFKIMVDENKKNATKNTEKEIQQMLEEDRSSITSFIDSLIKQINDMMGYVTNCREKFNASLKEVDIYYAIRILEFITENSSSFTFTKDNVFSYRNPDKNEFEIRTKYGESFNTDKIKKITGESIKVIKYQT